MGTIYISTCEITGKSYIGFTTKGLESRKQGHKYRFKSNKYKSHFYNAIQKYGWNNFNWTIIESLETTLNILKEKELYYIKKFDTFNNGYNSTIGGDGRGYFSGRKHSEATKAKIQKKTAGKNNPMYGRKHSEATKEKIRKRCNNSGKNNPMYGRKQSKETSEKISESLKGRKRTEETKRKMSEVHMGEKNPMYGRKHSPETIAKIKKAALRRNRADPGIQNQ